MICFRVYFDREIHEAMEAVQSRIRQRSSVLAPALSSLVKAVFFGLTGYFLTALPAGFAFETAALLAADSFLGAAAPRLAITFLAGVAFAREVEARVILAFGILCTFFNLVV